MQASNVIILTFKIFFKKCIVCACVFCHKWGGQRRVVNGLELELQADESHRARVLGSEPGSSGRTLLITPEPSLQLLLFSFYNYNF